MRKVKVFSGSSHPELSISIVEKLGIKPATVQFRTFPNHETVAEIGVSVRGEDVFIIQSGSDSVNDHLMELLIMINACKSASARRITAILPYFPYCKQSKKKRMRGAITAKLVANMLAVAGVDHVITVDLHSPLIQGFFNRPVDNLLAEPSIAKYIRENIEGYENAVVVSKNAGGAKRVTSLADKLNIDFALVHKDSSNIQTAAPPAQTFLSVQNNSTTFNTAIPKPATTSAAVQNLRVPEVPSLSTVTSVDSMQSYAFSTTSTGGNYRKKVTGDGQYELTLVGDVTDRIVFILDDLIDSVQSFIQTAEFLKNQGTAKDVYIVATHGILSGDALSEIQNCAHVKGLIVTNTYPIPQWKKDQTDKLSIIDISGVLAEAIRRTHNGESISYLFDVAV